jgi:hypothetical protein
MRSGICSARVGIARCAEGALLSANDDEVGESIA